MVENITYFFVFVDANCLLAVAMSGCDDGWMQHASQIKYSWPPITKSVVGLFVLFFVIWIASVISEPFGAFAKSHMSLSMVFINEGNFESIFLYAFYHQSFGELVFVGLAIWMFGTELQSMIGLKKWWAIQILSILTGGCVVIGWDYLLGMGTAIHGYHAAIIGLIAAFCWMKWNDTLYLFTIPLRGKTMLMICVGLSVVMALIDKVYVRLGLDLAGILWGILIAGGFFNLRLLRTRYRLWRARKKLKLIRGPERKDYGPN